MSTVLGAGVKPTRGFLLELKKRVKFIEEGHRLLEMKRDELGRELRSSLDTLGTQRSELEKRFEKALENLLRAYASLGSGEIESNKASTEKKVSIEVLPKSVMGILVPFLKIVERPILKNKFGVITRSTAHEFEDLLEDLLKITELESRIEMIADDLEKTNRKVNALEKIVIPDYNQVIKFIEDRIDEDMLEEIIRTKLVRELIHRRRV
ncbi:MAG: V-type ATP synthase subunit D [Candidatus Bathyarchaeota archaeon]|nr:V-type ATP synthase subunit D [Candidatus Bathyarchaeota archaeon]